MYSLTVTVISCVHELHQLVGLNCQLKSHLNRVPFIFNTYWMEERVGLSEVCLQTHVLLTHAALFPSLLHTTTKSWVRPAIKYYQMLKLAFNLQLSETNPLV